MGFKLVTTETVSALSQLAIDLKEAFDNGAKIIPINYEAEDGNADDLAWANRVAKWSKALQTTNGNERCEQ